MSLDEPVKTTKTKGTNWTAKIWDFLTSLALLALNITACTMDRYRGIMAGSSP